MWTLLRASAFSLVFVLALAGASAPRLIPPPEGPVAVVALPFAGKDAVTLAAASGGTILRSGRYPAVAVADGDAAFRAEVRRRGGMVLSPLAAFGCTPASGQGARA